MADIYNRDLPVHAGSFKPEGVTVNFSGGGSNLAGQGLVTQAVGFNYAQRAAMIYEVGSSNTYTVGGRMEGQATLNRIVGPSGLGPAFIRQYGDICSIRDNVLQFSARPNVCAFNTSSSGTENYRLSFVLINNLGLNIQATDNMINQALQMMFSACEIIG